MDGPLNVDHPLHLDGHGRTARTDADDHVRDLLEQLLFTAPGERVNRPDFGTGLLQLVFLPNAEPLAAATQAAVLGALGQWLGDRVEVRGVEVSAEGAVLQVTVRYAVRWTQEERVAVFTRAVP